MALIFTLFLLFSVFSAALQQNTAALSAAIMEGAGAGVTLAISLTGPICLWSGFSRLMEENGWMNALSRMFSPVMARLFPCAWQDTTAKEALCANLSANLLGLGNAATPAGVRAAGRMALGCQGRASDELCRLIVMNTASIQLVPATVAAVRASLGCHSPFDILPAVWLTSICSVSAGLLAAKLLSGFVR